LDKLLMRVLPENINLEFSFQPESYFVKADPTRLQQAIMNLALNGRDAMPNGGSLRFDLERIHLAPEDELPLPDLAPGDWIRLTVNDNGAGIPDEILPHIFDPFFTTKPVGKGTGLGLAQAYGIIKQHDGCIAVHSEKGRGSSFMIYLPALEMPEDEIVEPQPELKIMGNGETVLIVEDDPTARLAMISLLESQNYRTLDAQNGVKALEIFEKEQEAINLVVSDVVMPEMGGVALYKALRARNPLIKMLFITGHPLDFSDQVALEIGRAQWLQKPFSVLEFTSVLRTMLQESS
jgi:CheY-like chemotaxis protein